MSKLFGVLLFFVITGCESLVKVDIIGAWMYPEVQEDGVITMSRVSDIEDDQYGFVFREDGECSEFKIAGWCGTPPVTYAEYQGTWNRNDSVIDIAVGYWGGIVQYRWIVLSVDTRHLVYYPDTVRYISTEN